jgi:hypothetical protein
VSQGRHAALGLLRGLPDLVRHPRTEIAMLRLRLAFLHTRLWDTPLLSNTARPIQAQFELEERPGR